MTTEPTTPREAVARETAESYRACARLIIKCARVGTLDPREAAIALNLPYDQDIIMGILELAAAPDSPALTALKLAAVELASADDQLANTTDRTAGHIEVDCAVDDLKEAARAFAKEQREGEA